MDRILIANRGEIACRIIRSVQQLGKHAIAVYSEADADALHRHLADEAHCIGPAPAPQSYLNAEAMLHACGAIGRVGRVEDGNTVCDHDDLEKEFAELETSNVDDDLAALKAEMQKD